MAGLEYLLQCEFLVGEVMPAHGAPQAVQPRVVFAAAHRALGVYFMVFHRHDVETKTCKTDKTRFPCGGNRNRGLPANARLRICGLRQVLKVLTVLVHKSLIVVEIQFIFELPLCCLQAVVFADQAADVFGIGFGLAFELDYFAELVVYDFE